MPEFFRPAAAVFFLILSSLAVAQAPVQVETVAASDIVRQINITGTVTSPRTAVLSTAVAGIVDELTIEEGHRVATGDVLLKLDAELAQLALQRSRAELRQREIAVADANRRLIEAEDVGTERGIARTQIESLRAELAGDEAALVAAEAALHEQQAIVSRHTLKAPFGGVISERHAELGEWVNPGDPLLELVATDNLRFDFRVGQENYAALSPDTAIQITLDALPDLVIPGHVTTIVPVKNPGARTFLVRAIADSATAERMMTPGMSVRGKLKLGAGRSGLAISRDAVLRFPDGRITVWVVEADGELPVVREQLVSTGFEFDGRIEITRGLAAGDIVVNRGNETLQDGQRVTIQDKAD